jgi:hypothetical protein
MHGSHYQYLNLKTYGVTLYSQECFFYVTLSVYPHRAG